MFSTSNKFSHEFFISSLVQKPWFNNAVRFFWSLCLSAVNFVMALSSFQLSSSSSSCILILSMTPMKVKIKTPIPIFRFNFWCTICRIPLSTSTSYTIMWFKLFCFYWYHQIHWRFEQVTFKFKWANFISFKLHSLVKTSINTLTSSIGFLQHHPCTKEPKELISLASTSKANDSLFNCNYSLHWEFA